MKSHAAVLLIMVGTISGSSAPFQNLGFDEANTNHIVDTSGSGLSFYGPANEMLPGWQLSNGIPGPNLIGYNAITLGLNFATLSPGEGKYALSLYPGTDDNGAFAAYHLSQSGDVPADAKTLRFTNYGGPFDLRVNGQLLPLVYEYPPGYVHDRFAQSVVPIPVVGDISAFAGQTVGLEFITLPALSAFDFRLKAIDSISFSPELIPEPSTWALFTLGGIALLFRRRFS